jgi:chemotaxis signal transduction protein/nucleoid-associated protein YgaU
MPEIYLFNLDNQLYGLRKDEVEAVLEVETLHRLPFSPPFIAGLIAKEKKNTALVDLAALLAHDSCNHEGPFQAIFSAGLDRATAFVVSVPLSLSNIQGQEFTPLPESLRSPWISEYLVVDDLPLLIINLTELHHHVIKTKAAKALPPLSLNLPPTPAESAPDGDLRLFSCDAEVFAIPENMVVRSFSRPARAARLLFAEGQALAAIYNHEVGMIPLLYPDWLPKLETSSGRQILVIRWGNVDLGLLISEDLKTVKMSAGQPYPMPTLLTNSPIGSLFYWQKQIIPVIAPGHLLTPKEVPLKPVELQPDSNFPNDFARQTVNILEFTLLGDIHAVPRSEVEDIVPIRPIRAIPGPTSLVIGVSEYQDELLPVLDAAMVFGRRSLVDRNWRLILIKNGLFRGFILAAECSDEIELPRERQKFIPISLRGNLVYGCYPDSGGVRLILNIAALASYFNKVIVSEFIPIMSRAMIEAPARLVPELLPENIQDRSGTADQPASSTLSARTSASLPTPTELTLAENLTHHLHIEPGPNASRTLVNNETPAANLDYAGKVAETSGASSGNPKDKPEIEDDFTSSPEAFPADSDCSPVQISTIDSPAPADDHESYAIFPDHDSTEDVSAQATVDENREALRTTLTVPLEEALLEILLRIAEREDLLRDNAAVAVDAPKSATDKSLRKKDCGRELKKIINLDQELTSPKVLPRETAMTLTETQVTVREMKADLVRQLVEKNRLMAREKKNREKTLAESKASAVEQIAREREKSAAFQKGNTDYETLAQRLETRGKQRESLRPQDQTEQQAGFGKISVPGQQEIIPIEAIPPFATLISGPETAKTTERLATLAENRHFLKPAAAPEINAIMKRRRLLSRIFTVMALMLLFSGWLFYDILSVRNISEEPSPPLSGDMEKIVPANEGPGKKISTSEQPHPSPVGESSTPKLNPRNSSPSLIFIVPEDSPVKNGTYEIQHGDTLWGIARRFTGNPYNYPKVAKDNDIPNPDLIFPDQKITLKKMPGK